MSDERDETRQFSPFDDDTPAEPSRPDVNGPADGTRPMPRTPDDRTPPAPRPADDATVVTPGPIRPDATSVMPAVGDDWAASRGNPAWAGRAEVRAPRPGSTEYQETAWPGVPVREPRDRWWMPIMVGVAVLVLLAALGWGAYLLVKDSGNGDQPAPAPSPSAVPTRATATTASTPPSTKPTTTAPATTPSTTEPTPDEVTIPALKGRSLAEAEAALNQRGMGYRLLYRPSVAQPGTVIDSDPAEGQEVPPDTTVTLVIAAASTTTPTATLTTEPGDGSGGGD